MCRIRIIHAIRMAVCVICVLVCGLGGVVHAQGLLDSLLGQPAKGINIQTPEKQFQARLKKRLVVVNRLLDAQKKNENTVVSGLEKERQSFRKSLTEYQSPPKDKLLRGDVKAMGLRKQIAGMMEQNASLVGRVISARASYTENLRGLRDILQRLMNHDAKRLAAWVKKVYIKPKAFLRLEKDIYQLERRLEKSRKELAGSTKQLNEIATARDRNQTDLDQVRRNMVNLAPAPRVVPRPVPLRPINLPLRVVPRAKPAVKRRTKKRRRRGRKNRRTAPRKVVPAPPPKPVGPTPEELRQQKLQQALRSLQETLQEQQFAYFRKNSRWLNLRQRDEKLDIEIAKYRIKLYSSILVQMKDASQELASKTRGGLWFYRSLEFDPNLVVGVYRHTRKVLKEQPDEYMGVLADRLEVFADRSFSMQILVSISILLVVLVLFVGAFLLRRRLARSIKVVRERVDAGSLTRQMWGLIRLGLQSAHDGLPYLLIFSFAILLMWWWGLPFSWISSTLAFGLLVLAVRLGWTMVDSLFSIDTNRRFFAALDDKSAQRIRRVVKGFAIITLIYVPFLLAAHALAYPEGFTRWMDALFYTFVLIGSLLLLLNKDAVLSLIPMTHVVGRTLILFTNRFYPLVFFTALGIFGFYVWGYVNFAKYLAQGITFTLLLLSSAYGLYRLIWVFGLWIFGFTKGEGGLLQVEKRWARNVLRLIRMLSGVMLGLGSLSLLFEIWGIGGGARTLLGIFNYPFVQVKDTQITLVSLGQLFLSMGVAFWLSGFLKKKCKEYVYPALRLSLSDQHATNTVMSYVVIIVGALFGLQWMGVGIGVLAVFAGIVGIGVGFGIQNIASNFISGLIITFGKPIKVGDIIEVDGSMGEVKEISGRSTTIETFDLRIVLIPNSEILTKKVVNWSMGQPCVLVPLNVGVAYGSNVELVLQTLKEIAAAHPQVLKDPPLSLRFGDFGASSLDFSVWVPLRDPLKRFEIVSELRVMVDRRFRELGIVIAFPQRDIHLSPPLEGALIQAFSGKAAASTPSASATSSASAGAASTALPLPQKAD